MTMLLTVGGATLFMMMSVLWLIGMRIRNAAIVDAGWGAGYAVMAWLAFAFLDGMIARNVLVASMVSIWGLRLAWHLLADRILAGKPEDGRYEELRRKWGASIELKFFIFFQLQALMILALSLPVYLIMMNPDSSLSWLEWTGAALWCIGIAGEALADRQLARFKRSPGSVGKTCRVGLWNYSRHPNYFFEWIIWAAYFLMAIPAPHGWLAIVSPAVMLLVLTRLTGIPLTEAQALKSRGEEYRSYQKTTSAFIPWPKRGG